MTVCTPNLPFKALLLLTSKSYCNKLVTPCNKNKTCKFMFWGYTYSRVKGSLKIKRVGSTKGQRLPPEKTPLND